MLAADPAAGAAKKRSKTAVEFDDMEAGNRKYFRRKQCKPAPSTVLKILTSLFLSMGVPFTHRSTC